MQNDFPPSLRDRHAAIAIELARIERMPYLSRISAVPPLLHQLLAFNGALVDAIDTLERKVR